mgnify:CR=1 FL=1
MATLSQLKYQLKLVDDPADASIQADLDNELNRYLAAAIRQCEHDTSRIFSQKNLTKELQAWSDPIVIAAAPFVSLVSIEYKHLVGSVLTTSALDSAAFVFIKKSYGANLVLRSGFELPELAKDAADPVVITFTAGYSTPPEDMDSWVLMRAAALYINRETDNNLSSDPVPFADGLLDSTRRFTL